MLCSPNSPWPRVIDRDHRHLKVVDYAFQLICAIEPLKSERHSNAVYATK